MFLTPQISSRAQNEQPRGDDIKYQFCNDSNACLSCCSPTCPGGTGAHLMRSSAQNRNCPVQSAIRILRK